MNKVSITGTLSKSLSHFLEANTLKLMRALGLRSTFLSIELLSDKDMRNLKKRMLPKKSGPANVLSFPDPGNFPPLGKLHPLGTIYLNRELNRKNPNELFFLLVHGTLHLVGYGHSKKRDILNMVKRERELWQQILSLD